MSSCFGCFLLFLVLVLLCDFVVVYPLICCQCTLAWCWECYLYSICFQVLCVCVNHFEAGSHRVATFLLFVAGVCWFHKILGFHRACRHNRVLPYNHFLLFAAFTMQDLKDDFTRVLASLARLPRFV